MNGLCPEQAFETDVPIGLGGKQIVLAVDANWGALRAVNAETDKIGLCLRPRGGSTRCGVGGERLGVLRGWIAEYLGDIAGRAGTGVFQHDVRRREKTESRGQSCRTTLKREEST